MDNAKLGKDAAATLMILMEHQKPRNGEECLLVLHTVLVTAIVSIAANTDLDTAIETTVDALKVAGQTLGANVDVDIVKGAPCSTHKH